MTGMSDNVIPMDSARTRESRRERALDHAIGMLRRPGVARVNVMFDPDDSTRIRFVALDNEGQAVSTVTIDQDGNLVE